MIGESISHYKILEKLGEGGMGMVYKALDTRLDRHVALKFLSPSLESDSEVTKRFINEAKTASSLDHANIGAIYDIDETADGQMFIAMAYYEGETLKHTISGGQLSVQTVLDYAIQIARGLTRAHENGIIHRDLKPANILITKDGVAKIIDFGLAKLQGGGQLTRTGASVGTIAYMSPEQARGEDTDKRTDIASLGSVMYEMLTGKPPYQAEFDAAILYLIVNEEPKAPSTHRTDVPSGLEMIVKRMMYKDPAERYQNMSEVLNDLTSVEQVLRYGTGPAVSSPSRVLRIPTLRVNLKIGPLFFGVALILTVAMALLLLRFFSGKKEFTSADRSVIVLPIENLSDPELQYLADGISKNIIRRLSSVPDVITVSSTTSSLYKNSPLTDDSLTARLGVRFVVKGFLRILGTKAFLEVFMHDGHNREQVWRAPLEGDRSELLNLETQVVRMILGGMGIEEKGMSLGNDSPGPEVYEGYLWAIHYMGSVQESDFALAKEILRDLLRKDSTYAPAWSLLSQAYVIAYQNHWKATDEDLRMAEDAARKALALDSTSFRPHVELANIQSLRGDLTGAVTLLQRVLEKKPNDVAALQSLAQIYLVEGGDQARGLFYMKKILAYDPSDWIVLMNTGIAYAQLKDYAQATHFFSRAAAINSEDADIWTNLGYTYERIARYDSAAIYYAVAIAKVPSNNQPFLNLSDLYIASANFSAAESLLARRLKSDPKDDELLYRLAFVLGKMGKASLARETYVEGKKVLEERMKKNKTSGQYRASYGLYQARLNYFKSAIEYGEEAMRIDSSEEVTIALAKIYAITGMREKMMQAFRAAKEKNVEYDVEYLHSAFDFAQYQRDAGLLAIARQR